MQRHQIIWSAHPVDVRLRGCTSTGQADVAAAGELHKNSQLPVAASFPNEAGRPVSTAPPPPPDIRPLLETIAVALESIQERRQQSLAELQHVALELAVSVASNLVFEAISKDQFAVEQLVLSAIHSIGIDSAPIVSLNPKDLELLQRRLASEPAPWNADQMTLRSDASLGRGSCRVENESGRSLVSDISLRLSEIRRHWLEELDDSQIERRGAAGEGASLRRFPDRREIA